MISPPPKFTTNNAFRRIDVPAMLKRLGIEDVKVVGDGKRLTASCPNPEHDDRKASWFIRDNPGEPYHAAHACQGCGFRGGPILLASTLLNIDEEDARAWLKDLAAPPPLPASIEIEVKEVRSSRPFAIPEEVVFERFANWPPEFADYLTVKRRLDAWQVGRWGFGYVPRSEQHRLSGRIVMPIRDDLGRPCSYTARSIADGARLRYLEPEASENPRRCIFGTQHWARATTCVVVEGVFDALAVERVVHKRFGAADEVSVAALRGSSPHPVALARLAQFLKLIIMTDPDKAGKKALAAIRAACGRHSDVCVIRLPKGQDGKKAFDPADIGDEWLTEKLSRFIERSG